MMTLGGGAQLVQRLGSRVLMAVLKPKLTSVSLRSLSIVLGTPTIGAPRAVRRCAMAIVPSPPATMSASSRDASFAQQLPARRPHRYPAVGLLYAQRERVATIGCAQNSAATRQQTAYPVHVQRDARRSPHTGRQSRRGSRSLPAVTPDRGQHDRADNRVETGRIAAARQDADSFRHFHATLSQTGHHL